MSNSYKEFKEQNKDFNLSLPKRLDKKILIKVEDPNNKSIVPKSNHQLIKSSRKGVRGKIECNFDKGLLGFIEEMSSFQENSGFGGPNFGSRVEEIVGQQRHKLRVYRENVMTVVRDYNQVLELMDDFERELFRDHLKKINESIQRGTVSLKWNSQGTLDNFVKDCRSKCVIVQKKIMEFKQGKRNVIKKVKEISDKIKFINFDSRKVVEISSFLIEQERVRENAQTQLEKIFMEIEKEITDVYENFISMSLPIQKQWFNFIKEIDQLLESQFRKTSKLSLIELLKAITGDEKTNTNPTQIFKIYVILHVREKDNNLDFDPTLKEFQEKIEIMLNKCVEIFKIFRRLPILILEARKARILRINEKMKDEQNKKKMYNKNKKRTEFVEITDDILDCKEHTYEESVHRELEPIISDIKINLKYQCKKILKQLEPWKKNQFLRIGSSDTSRYTKDLFNKNVSVQRLTDAVVYYDNIQSEIQIEKCSDDSVSIHVDTTKIKQTLENLNYEEQKMLLLKIKENSLQELNNLKKKFERSKEFFEETPDDLMKLKNSQDLVESLMMQKPAIEESLIPLEEKFRLLDEYMIVFTEEEKRQRMTIRQNFEQFCQILDKIKEENQGYFMRYFQDHKKKLEIFNKDVREYREMIIKERPNKVIEKENEIEIAENLINKFREGLADLFQREKNMEFGFGLFNIEYNQIPEIKMIKTEIEQLKNFWKIKKEWNSQLVSFKNIQFRDIKTELIKEECQNVIETVEELPIQVKKWEVSKNLVQEIEIQKKIFNLISLLQDQCLRERHWDKIKENLKNRDFNIKSEEFNFGAILDMNIIKISEIIRETQEKALSEYKIEEKLQDIILKWDSEKIQFDQIKNTKEIIIKSTYADRITKFLEEDLICLSTLKTNVYATVFSKQIQIQDQELNKISEVMDLLMIVQKRFIYFNNIFLNLKEELGQLKGDKSKFSNVKQIFLRYMNDFQEDKTIKKNLLLPHFKNSLESMNQELEIIQKNMRKYLEKRRIEIPRFYFLSDEDIFQILGKTKDPSCLNKNIKKMFEGIKKLEFVTKSSKGKFGEYTHMVSSCGEKVEFSNSVEINGDLNQIVTNIEKEMKAKIQIDIYKSLLEINNSQIQKGKDIDKLELWLKKPGQVLISTCQIQWTQRVQQNLIKNEETHKKKSTHKDFWQTMKNSYNKVIQNFILFIRKQKIPPILKKKLVALIIIEVHHKDLIDRLQTETVNSYKWLQLLRYKENNIQEKSFITVEQGQGEFQYGYEYQGNNGRLVITPLTDKCYLTLTTALHYRKGGNLQGPAGTGKTETVKDLGKNLGRFVFIYNCSEGIDVKNMNDLFEGFVMTGFWGCFDEFNRIEIEVLSILAIQINTIQEAIASGLETFEFVDKEIPLNQNCALFITMNPGYVGRSELPDNLKNLFRPISMMVPDSAQICRISLQAEGFKCSDQLSQKIDILYSLMKKILSQEKHYDFGLRAIKSVLILAGNFRRTVYKSNVNKVKESELVYEQKILIRAIKAINEPKLISNDVLLFESLVKDLFPDEQNNVKETDNDLLQYIDKVMDEMNLDKNPYFVEKVIQLYYTKNTRHGNIIIGDSMSGKSSLLNVLREIQNKQNLKTNVSSLNPKTFSIREIYGYYDQQADQNILGVFSNLMVELFNRENENEENWIVFDGPIDTKWIESMNSLLDDNKVLTLLDGNRINLKPNVKIIFEVDELSQASPATVSRCGMIYVDVKELNWQSLRIKWLLEKDQVNQSAMMLDFLDDLFDKWVEPLMNLKSKIRHLETCKLSDQSSIKNFTLLYDIFFDKYIKDIPVQKDFQINDMQMINIEKIFVYSVIWSIGSNLKPEGKIKFDHLLRDIEGIFPFTNLVYDYYLNFDKFEFMSWEGRLTIAPNQWKPPAELKNQSLLVETVDNMRLRYFIKLLLMEKIHVLNVGESGVGKSSLIKSILFNLDESLFSFSIVNMTPGTTSKRLQQNIESKLNRTTKKKFRPFSGKSGFVFIDDLAMPRKDEFGYKPSIELIRQFIEFSGWYDRNTLDMFVEIKDLVSISAIRDNQNINSRLLNKYFVLSSFIPSDKQLKRIYSSILFYNLNEFDAEEIKPEIENVTKYIISIFKIISAEETMKSTPFKPHYLFSMKDMNRLVGGISLINKLNCDSKTILLKLLVHETRRIYEDKMFEAKDKEFLENIINEELDMIFGVRLDELENESSPIIFTNFFDVKKSYTLLPEIEKDENWTTQIRKVLNENLDQYNKDKKIPLNIVLFKEAILYLCKVNRVLNIEGGNVLFIGEGGTGKHSLTKLSAYINEFQIYEQKGSDNIKLFRQGIKQLFEKIIVKRNNEKIVMLFSDSKIKNEAVLEDVNSLLNLGEIPNLFQKVDGRDDFQNIREKLILLGVKDSEEYLYSEFVNIIKKNIHIVFCCGREGEKLRHFSRNYSGLIYNTTQIFYENWPESALLEVAEKFLEDENVERVELLAEYFAFTHRMVRETAQQVQEEVQRKFFITQKNFVDFSSCFKKMLKEKKEEIKKMIEKYSNGLMRLEETKLKVDELKNSMDLKRLELEKKKNDSEQMINEINKQKDETSNEEKVIEEKELFLKQESEKIEEMTKKAQKILDESKETIQAAKENVKGFDSNTWGQIKELCKTKDKRIEYIMFSLMVLLRQKREWATVQNNFTDASFLNRIKEIDMDKITNSDIEKLEKYTQKPEIQGNLESYSHNANILVKYIRGVETYAKINNDLKPTRKKIEKLQIKKKQMEDELAKLKQNLQQTKGKSKELGLKFEQKNNEYQDSLKKYDQLEKRLDRSEKLVRGLSSSQDSWLTQKEDQQNQLTCVLGDVMLSSAILSYFGPFPSEYRETMKGTLKNFLLRNEVKFSARYNFVNFLIQQVEILRWNFQGLPDDKVSIENGVIVKKSNNWPLMIDPQGQGLNWIKQCEEENQMLIMDSTKGRATQIIKKAIIDGIPLLLKNVDQNIPSEYMPILNKNLKRLGPSRLLMHYNEEQISYNENFRFYLTSRQNNPIYSPEVTAKVTLVNFSVKSSGLEEQLLGVLLKILDEKIEVQRVDCIKKMANYKSKLLELDNRILQMLIEDRKMDIVDDIELIETLQISRENEQEIIITIEKNKTTLKKNQNSRENYRYIGKIASLLYFTIQQLDKIQFVYQFPLNRYIVEFEQTLKLFKVTQNDFSDSIQDKIKKIDKALRFNIYKKTCDALMEKDRILLAFLLSINLAPIDQKNNQKEQIQSQQKTVYGKQLSMGEDEIEEQKKKAMYFEKEFPQEYEFFVRNLHNVDRENQEMNPDNSWISQNMWDCVHALNSLPNFQGILGSFLHSTREWRNVFSSSHPENEALPSDWSQKIQGFSQLLLIKILRPDRIIFGCQNFVKQTLGSQYIEQTTVDIEKVYKSVKELDQIIPILILQGDYVDPWTQIESLAKQLKKSVVQISLSKGQINKAKEMIGKALEQGRWIYVGNIHLNKNFLYSFEIIIEFLRTSPNKNKDFQIFFSSKPVDYLPLNLLHNCMKITMEPSKGIKASLMRLMKNTIQDYTPSIENEDLGVFKKYKKIIYSLCWFHSVLNERKRFKSLGWNKQYEFTDSDFSFSEKIIKKMIERDFKLGSKGIQWDSIRQIFSQINYGGRITDPWDQRLVDVYTKDIFRNDLLTNSNYQLSEFEGNQFYVQPVEDQDAQFNMKIKNLNNLTYFYSQMKPNFIKEIQKYPQNEDPILFGQHINAEINMRIEDSTQLISSLELLHVGKNENLQGDSIDMGVFRIVGNIKDKLPEPLNQDNFIQKLLKINRDLKEAFTQPLNTVVLQESEKLNKLLAIINEDLEQIENCLVGKVLISEEIEILVREFSLHQVPQRWSQFYLSTKSLFGWLQDLVLRFEQIEQWFAKSSLQVYWLGGLVYPSGFLTAIIQQSSRTTNVPIDDIKFDFSFVENEANIHKIKDGAYLKGFYLEGAKWNSLNSTLDDAEPMTLYYNMPFIKLKTVEKIVRGNSKLSYYQCPVYVCPNRAGNSYLTSYLLTISLPFVDKEYDQDFWIKRGTACLLSLNY